MSSDRERVLEGLSAAVDEKGYSGATIADIARHARISKRTFYEHFTDKESCFLEAYRNASALLQGILRAAAAGDGDPRARVDAIVTAYLGALDLDPARARTFLLEIYAAGPTALAVRREVHGEFARLLSELGERAEVRGLHADLATALVGAIHELVLMSLERGKPTLEIATTAREVAQALLFGRS